MITKHHSLIRKTVLLIDWKLNMLQINRAININNMEIVCLDDDACNILDGKEI